MRTQKIFLLFAFIAIPFFPLHAKKVNVEKAETVAKQHVKSRMAITPTDAQLKLVYTGIAGSVKVSKSAGLTDESVYYVFNRRDNQGFVIVSADDVATPVLGYSDTGNYDADNLPPNFVYWMEYLSSQIVYAIENELPQLEETKKLWDNYMTGNIAKATTAVTPMVQTEWNQYAPYNNLCPEVSGVRTVTGCVATAMAQIMKYYNYPVSRDITLPEYTTSAHGFIIFDVPGTTYNWGNMTNTYGSYSTSVENDAVAKLMYDCGVSVNMNYNTAQAGGSGAVTRYVGGALYEYFGYDASLQWKDRIYYSDTDWDDILRSEINEGCPVLYSGQGPAGGHAFICNGYDDSDRFYFNWGWGGSQDGYFATKALNTSNGTFNNDQGILINIKPDEGGVTTPELKIQNLTSNKAALDKGESFIYGVDISNRGLFDFSGYFGIVLVDENDQIITIIREIDRTSNPLRSNYTTFISNSTYTIPSSFSAGYYYLRVAYRLANEVSWTIATGAIGGVDRLLITVGNPGPDVTAWSPPSGSTSTDWTSGSNWSHGVPGEITNVTIKGGMSSYPELEVATTIGNIIFEPGAELGGQNFLDYKKAFVEYDFGTGERSTHFRMLAVPLQEAYPGDYTFGGHPKVWFELFEVNNGVGSWETPVVKDRAFTAGSGFVVSLDPDGESNLGLKLTGGILRLPFFDEDSGVPLDVHPNHSFEPWISTFANPNNSGSGDYTVSRSDKAYRLAEESVSMEPDFGLNRNSLFALVGNPSMTTINFNLLQAENEGLIKNNYRIWTKWRDVEGYAGYTSGVGGFGIVMDPGLDNFIAPLQGFIVERQESPSHSELTFSLAGISATGQGTLRSPAAPQENKLDIVAANAGVKVRTFIAKREDGSEQFGERDARKLSNGLTSVPDIYTLKPSENEWIAVGANITDSFDMEYPVGIATTFSGDITFTLTGMDSYNAQVFFIDRELDKEIELTGLVDYEYTFAYTPNENEGSTIPTDDRFYIRTISFGPTIIDKLNTQSLVVYTDKGYIHAVSGESDTIREFNVYNLDGVQVYRSVVNALSYITGKSFGTGIYLVQVKTDKGTIHKKIIINR